MQRLIAECEVRGYRQMIAVIGDSANAARSAFTSRPGSDNRNPPECRLKFDACSNTVMMQRALGEGATTVPLRSRDGANGSRERAPMTARAIGNKKRPTGPGFRFASSGLQAQTQIAKTTHAQ